MRAISRPVPLYSPIILIKSGLMSKSSTLTIGKRKVVYNSCMFTKSPRNDPPPLYVLWLYKVRYRGYGCYCQLPSPRFCTHDAAFSRNNTLSSWLCVYEISVVGTCDSRLRRLAIPLCSRLDLTLHIEDHWLILYISYKNCFKS